MIGSYYQSLFIFQSTTKRVGELLSELIRSLIEQHTFCDRELSPKLIESPIDQKLWRSGALIRAHWLPDRSPIDQNFLRSGALVRARWLPDRSKTSCDQKLLLELIDSIVDQQLCDRETLSDLIESLIDQNLLAIRSSYESTLTSWSTDTLVVIGSSY